MYHIFFIHSSVVGQLDYFSVLAIVNSATVNIGVHVNFQITVFSRYLPRSGIVGSYGSSVFSFFLIPKKAPKLLGFFFLRIIEIKFFYP